MNLKDVIKKEIILYYDKNLSMPTVRYLMNKFNYHSTNTIYKYLKKLELEGFLKRNDNNKLVINNRYSTNIKEIPIINGRGVIKLSLDKEKDYLGYQIKNNYMNRDFIIKGDIVIIEVTKTVSRKGIGLFNINNNNILARYEKKDELFILDYENIVVCDITSLVGKVIWLERNIKSTIRKANSTIF